MKVSTESLIRSLVTDLRPVLPLRPAKQMIGRLGLALTAFTGVLLGLTGVRSDFGVVAQTPWFWMESGLLLWLVGLCASAIVFLRNPGVPHRRFWLLGALVGSCVWLGVFAAGAFVREGGFEAYTLRSDFAVGCSLELILCSLPPWGLFVWVSRRGFLTSPWRMAFFTGLGALSISLALLSWVCPDDSFAHVAVWHLMPFFLFGVLSILAAYHVFSQNSSFWRRAALLPFALLAAFGALLPAVFSVFSKGSTYDFDWSVVLLPMAHMLGGLFLGGLSARLSKGLSEGQSAFAWVSLGVALAPTVLALVASKHLAWATEWTAAWALVSSAAFLSRDAFGFGGLGAIAPLLLLSSYAGPAGSWSYGVALACMWAVTVLAPGGGVPQKRGWNLLALAPLLPIAFLPILRTFRLSPLESEPVIYGPWVVANVAAGGRPHTDFVLGAVAQAHGDTVAWGLVLVFALGSVLVFWRAWLFQDLFTRLLALGTVVFFGLQAAWNLNAVRGAFPVPPGGTFFPFLSSGAPYTVLCGALLVLLWSRFQSESKDAP